MENNFMTKEGTELLIYKRRLGDYTQTDISRILGLSPSTYNRKELGLKDWRNDERVKLIKYLKLNDEERKVIFLA